jgi:predicted  nucleic acid-binding Zn-ribbon protein
MGKWNIYHSDGNVVKDGNGIAVDVYSLEYNDEWMGECSVTADITSSVPIDFRIGDYIEYRGERFEINYDPGKSKTARANSYGEAFKYSGVKFMSLSYELVRCDFLDVVLSDNNLHYTALPKFSFYVESLDDLLDRIQANVDELYGKGVWKLYSRNKERSIGRGCDASEWSSVYGDGIGDSVIESASVSVDNQTCWEALALVNSTFDVNFIVRGRNVYVGTEGIPTTNIFKYGKGNGLYEIAQTADSEQTIVTRLRAYGSTKNLPSHYYADLGGIPFMELDSYEISSSSGTYAVAITLPNVIFDGIFIDIYYSAEALKNGNVSFKISDAEYSGKIVLQKITDSIFANSVIYVSGSSSVTSALRTALSSGVKKLSFTSGVNRSKFDSDQMDYSYSRLPNNMACDRLMLPGFPKQSLSEWWSSLSAAEKSEIYDGEKVFVFSDNIWRPYVDSPNMSELGVRPASVYFDTEDKKEGIDEIYPTIEEMEVGGQRIDEIYIGSDVSDNGRVDSETIDNTYIYLRPEINFNLNEYRDESFAISMKDGKCAGRSFEIASCKKMDDDSWRLGIKRVLDFGLWFPYSDFQIEAGDHFVLTGLTLPDEYVEAASRKLLKYALAFLSDNDYTNYVYEPKVDEIYMARQHDEAMADEAGEARSLYMTLKAGDIMRFSDEDFGIVGNIAIDKLSIKESDGNIPEYSITLREEKQVGTIQKIQNKISSIESGSGKVGGAVYSQMNEMVLDAASKRFLSKTKADTALGRIDFQKGLSVVGKVIESLTLDGGFAGVGNNDTSDSRVPTEKAVARAFLRKDINDIASFLIRFLKGLEIGDGSWYFDETGKLVARDVTTKNLEVTGAAHFFQLIIDQVRSVGGRMILSAASCEAMHVEEMSGCHRVYFLADDGENGVTNNWQVNDLAICQSFNLGAGSYNDVSNKYYWRKVVGCSYNAKTYDFDTTERKYYYIDLSNIYGEYDANSNAAPSAGDSIVQLGNSNNAERASAIIMSAYNDTWIDSELKAPSISQYIGIGISTSSQPFNFTLAPYRHTWFSLDSNEIRGKFRVVTSSGADKDVGEIVEEMANALDGDIQFWFYDYAPSLENAPAAEWIAQGTADQHVGDIFYDTSRSGDFTGGTTFKFVKTDENAYAWQPVTDAQTLKSLQLIADAADDGIISGGSELSRLYLTWKEQQTLFSSITAAADDSSQKRELNTSWTNLCRMLNDDTPLGDISTGLPSWFSNLSVDITLSEHTYDGNELDAVTYREMWNAYYTAYANLQKVVNEQINTRIDDNTTEIEKTRAEFEVTTNSIRSEVNTFTTKVTTIEGTVGRINTTVTEQNTKIEQLSDRITSEVTERITTIEETVDGINTTVTQQNSKIEQLSGKITTEVTELTNKISTVNDRVDAQDGTIGTLQEEVGKIPLKTDADLTEYTGSIEVTSRKIALEVSEITDVRRNMLMGTQFWKNIGYDTDGYRVNGSGATLIRRTADTINGHNSLEISSSSTSNTYGGIYFLNIPVEAGKSYTISVWAKRMSSSLGNGTSMIVHYKANSEQGTPTWQESQRLVTTADTIGKWVLVTKTITPRAGDYFVNVIFCLTSSGTIRIAEPMMEESEEYTAWSPSPKDYAYVMGNMLPDSDTLKIVSSGEGLTQVYGRTADTDEAGIYMSKGTATATYVTSNSSWTAGYRTLITMSKTFSKGNSYILSFYARRTSAANDYAGLCVNFGSNVLIAEHSTGISRFSEDQGSSPYSGYVKIKNVPNTWTRYWVHVITNDNVTLTPQIYIEVTGGNVDSSGNISGNTGTFLVKKPKLEYGAALTEWTTSADDLAEEETVANQLHKTGINITKGLIELNAENTIIDGNLHLRGVLVENYTENTDDFIICDMIKNKSVSVGHSTVVLPMINNITITRGASESVVVSAVKEAGVKLTIAAKYNPYVAKWATGAADKYTDDVMLSFHNHLTTIIADPRIVSYDNYASDGTPVIDPLGGGGYQATNYEGGVFVCNGRRGRVLLLMPGQILHLTSAIEQINGKNILLWYVDNSSDFMPIRKQAIFWAESSYTCLFTTEGGSAWPMEVGASSGSEYMECMFAPKQLSAPQDSHTTPDLNIYCD